jgi:beta-lactam-binding protein with PASTA domain
MSTKGKTAKRALFVLAVWVLLAIVVLVLMDRVVMPWLVHHARQIQVPNVVEMSLAEADSALVEAGLIMMEQGGEYDPFVPAGLILSQSPEGGSLVRGKGRWVRVVVSKGGKKVTVPNLQGVSLRQATFLLNRCSLELGQISWMYTEDLPENVVISSAPGYKAEVLQGEVIDLLVSQGHVPSTAIVPDFIGQSLEGAVLLARDSGLRIGKITYRQDDSLLPETVLEQSVEVGQEVDRETAINLLVSTIK